MCGIIGYVGTKPALPILIEGLRRLEYRGYDSAGVALTDKGFLTVTKSAGRLSVLENLLDLEFKVTGVSSALRAAQPCRDSVRVVRRKDPTCNLQDINYKTFRRIRLPDQTEGISPPCRAPWLP